MFFWQFRNIAQSRTCRFDNTKLLQIKNAVDTRRISYKKKAAPMSRGGQDSGCLAGVAFSCISQAPRSALSLPSACGLYEFYHLKQPILSYLYYIIFILHCQYFSFCILACCCATAVQNACHFHQLQSIWNFCSLGHLPLPPSAKLY